MFKLFLIYSSALCAITTASEINYNNPVRDKHSDVITNLPGLAGSLNEYQYSGYLETNEAGSFVHYWLVESQTNPAKDPLLLWLNGGPGCSSLFGMFDEIGPLVLNKNGTITRREFAWNKNANILFLESPTDVGYSYRSSKIDYDDDLTVTINYYALISFMNKFPEYKGRELYISGESYAGIYIPTLAVHLVKQNFFNFKGIAIGNGIMNFITFAKTSVFYLYHHGIIDETIWKSVSKHCCDGQPPAYESCEFDGLGCDQVLEYINDMQWFNGLNPYNYIADCYNSENNEKMNLKVSTKLNDDNDLDDDREFSRLAATYKLISKSFDLLTNSSNLRSTTSFNYNTTNIGARTPLCSDDKHYIKYFDRSDVRLALHIPLELKRWEGPCASIHYNISKDSLGMTPFMQSLLNSSRDLIILLYYGDLDLACNFLGGRQFSEDLKRKVVSESKDWRLRNQIAGFYKKYKGFTYATVKGAGHMVPTDKPEEALLMINKFLLKAS